MLQLPGAPAFSSFRITKLLERIQREGADESDYEFLGATS